MKFMMADDGGGPSERGVEKLIQQRKEQEKMYESISGQDYIKKHKANWKK